MTDQPAPLTPPANATEARAVLDARMADKDWGGRVFSGDIAANKELRELTAMVAAGGNDTVTVAMSGNPANMPTTDQAQMAHTTALFRQLGIRDEVTSQFLRGEQVTPQEYEAVANWKKEQMGDEAFVKRFLAGDVKARQQMLIADTVLVNGIKSKAAAA
jgi:lysophospholipase L1-like esterase